MRVRTVDINLGTGRERVVVKKSECEWAVKRAAEKIVVGVQVCVW